MRIWYNSRSGILKVEGSLPYFFKGHNFTFTKAELVQAVEIIDTTLGCVGLWAAELNKFENGIIVPVEGKPKDYIAKHYAQEGRHLKGILNEKYSGKFMQWQNALEDLKLYDAGANILMKQGLARRDVIEEAGWDPAGNYVKWEVRYKKPAALNMGRAVYLEALQNEKFLNMLKGDLMENYHTLQPAKSLLLPSDKKDFSSLDAVLITLAQAVINQQGLPLQEAKKQIYETINQAGCLSKADKDARKAQIRKAFCKLEQAPSSRWDLTEKLEEALENE